MPHYHFNLRSPEGLSRDEEGIQHRDLREALQDAHRTIEIYLKDAAAEGRDDGDCSFEITDPMGIVLRRVRFRALH